MTYCQHPLVVILKEESISKSTQSYQKKHGLDRSWNGSVQEQKRQKKVIEGYWDSWMQRSGKVRQQHIVKRYGFDNKGKPQSDSAERMAFLLTGLEPCGANSVSPGLVSLNKFLGQDPGTNSLMTHWSFRD
eukprot:g25375.t1